MSFRQDVYYALRALAGRRLYALASIAVLAIAIGANTTVFSVFNGLFLRPLPYPDGDRLVMVFDSYPKISLDNAGTSIPSYLDRREEAPSLESLAILTTAPRTLAGEGVPQRALVARASASMFDVLRVRPVAGRAFTADEAVLGNDRVVVLSHRLWTTRFGAGWPISRMRCRGMPGPASPCWGRSHLLKPTSRSTRRPSRRCWRPSRSAARGRSTRPSRTTITPPASR